jgi:co-chaperonin GroES (HSP10)
MSGVSGVRLSDRGLNFIAPELDIRPLRDQIIVKPLPLKWSDTVDAEYSGEVTRGTVIAVGPGCYPNIHERGTKPGKDGRPVPYHTITPSRVFRPTEVRVGDIVELGGLEIGGYLFPKVWADGAWCIICREQDVAALHDRD